MPKAEKPTRLTREDRIQIALKEFKDGLFPDIAKAARAHDVPRSTLSKRIRGVTSSASVGHAHQQKVSTPAKSALVDWCIFSGIMGITWTKTELLSHAQELAGPGVEISPRWCRRFLRRHRRKLKYKFAYELDPKRASGFNRPTMAAHFETFKKMMEDYNIPAAHLYNMDEKGIQTGGGRSTSRRKHLFGVLQKACYKLKHDSLELMSIIECICADGFAMKPTIVHQGGDVGLWWKDKRIACCVTSENGWTSDDICESWFLKVFVKTTLERRVLDVPIVLLLDGHGSHISSRIRDIAFQNRIFLFCLPPKTTHKAQPLDIGVFNLVQAEWKKICEESAKNGEPVSKAATIAKCMEAREAGLHPAAILDAWRRSAHHPIDPSVFTDEDYAPSMVSSINTHLPPSFPSSSTPTGPEPPADSEMTFSEDPVDERVSCDSAELEEPNDIPSESATRLGPSDTEPQSEPAAEVLAGMPTSFGTTNITQASAPIIFTPKPSRDQYIGDWQGLRLKEQVIGYQSDIESLWEALGDMWGQLQTSNAHAVLLRHENEDLRRQLQARNKPKRTQAEAAAALKVQKHGFLTNPESEDMFREQMANEQAKRTAEAQKVADKEAREREIQGKRSLMLVDQDHVFEGTLLGYKNATLQRLGDLAASLALPFTGLKRAEIFEVICSHFEAHPELKSIPRYSNLFRASRSGRRVSNEEVVMPVSHPGSLAGV